MCPKVNTVSFLLAEREKLQPIHSNPSSLLGEVWWWWGFCHLPPNGNFHPGNCLTTYFYFLPRASYSDGKIKAPPKPCAGNQGTQVMVRFFCMLSCCSLVFMFVPPIGMCCIAREEVGHIAQKSGKLGRDRQADLQLVLRWDDATADVSMWSGWDRRLW